MRVRDTGCVIRDARWPIRNEDHFCRLAVSLSISQSRYLETRWKCDSFGGCPAVGVDSHRSERCRLNETESRNRNAFRNREPHISRFLTFTLRLRLLILDSWNFALGIST